MLLRMQPLECAARLFAEAAGAYAALQPGERQQQAPIAPAHCPWFMGKLLMVLLQLVLQVCEHNNPALWQITAVLRKSCVLEHAGRLLLALGFLARPDARLGMLSTLLESYTHACTLYERLDYEQGSAEQDVVVADFCEALSGRCVRHVVLVHGLAALCAADGGPSYGEVLAAVPIAGAGGMFAFNLRRRHGRQQLSPLLTRALMKALVLSCDAGPPGRRASVALLLRLVRLALASARVWNAHPLAAAGAAAAATAAFDAAAAEECIPPGLQLPPRPHEERLELVLTPDDSPDVAAASLREVLEVLLDQLEGRPWGSCAWAAEAGAEWWRLAPAVALETMRWACASTARQMGELLLMALRDMPPVADGLPPAPPLQLACALAGGLLPCLEHLLRRAGEQPACPEGQVVAGLLASPSAGDILQRLLAYGEPRQAAALVATVAKLLRRMDPSAVNVREITLEEEGPAKLHGVTMHIAFQMLSSGQHLVGRGFGGGGTATAGGAGGDGGRCDSGGGGAKRLPGQQQQQQQQLQQQQLQQQQLQHRAMMRLVVCEWLPPLSRLFLAAMALDSACLGRGATIEDDGPLQVIWLLLRALCSHCHCHGAGSGYGSQWRALVVDEACAVPLMGVSLRLAQRPGGGAPAGFLHTADHLPELLDTCRAVLLACPEAVGTAACATAAVGAPGSQAPVGSGGAAFDPASASRRFGWRPELLSGLLPEGATPRLDDRSRFACLAEALAARLKSWIADGGVPEGTDATFYVPDTALRGAPTLTDLRGALRTCSHRGCVSLAGGSEADARLQACWGGCGATWYCCRECQAAHWRVGHKQECAARRA
ncbi:hypothetical protein TSOC_005335 [Tetrabaena socialis]|uniref:phytol kinase n=1 Tax=Tetrabaena socialis TaxID=47790 RepID=A0A2J8A6I1_9CHLO|nr:hypothetical protein TSOC_005335 [Tetrabaena socialis]|eukprot:PNH08136.1 hypothetical protein TSOC_005335 [Tetrabaena socialis]